ncbi:MAG: hypothetical protein JNL38_14870 [Myxococcales bacterium]|jgi:hypothetical protein|nr:hypothetical protein [Myxococcales bacterium]
MTSTFVDRRAWAALALLGCLFASPGAARADAGPSAEDVAAARDRLREGVVLRDRGELQPAIEKLRVAYTIIPTPVTAVELGKAYVLAGRILDARELFLSVRRIAVHPEETARSQSAREEAARAALELEPRIPSLLVSLELAKGATAAVTIDDAPVLVDALKDPRKMNPGHHVVVARAGDGPEERAEVDLREGEVKEIKLAPRWVPPAVKPPPAAGTTTERVVIRQAAHPSLWVGFSVAAVGLAATSAFTVFAFDRANARDKCQEGYCPPNVMQGDIAEARGFATGATIGAVVLGAGLVTGFIGVVLSVRANEKGQTAERLPRLLRGEL